MTVQQTKEMLIAVSDHIMKSCGYLTEIDSKIGDGDHGEGMTRGFKAVKQMLTGSDFDSINQLFMETGMTLLDSMGGASGVIFGTLFISGISGMEQKSELDVKTLAAVMRKGFEAIRERGKAELGDKTMLDALHPAVIALEDHAGRVADSIAVALKSAWKAAEQGVESTKNMLAKKGRARQFREESVGYQDAGATSVMLIFEAMHKYAERI